MLTIKENLHEVMSGGKPDRHVNQYEFLRMLSTPFSLYNPGPKYGEENIVNAWNVTRSWPIGTPGAFPIHTPEKTVVKDISHWRDYVKAPSVKWSSAEWEPYQKAAENTPEDVYRTVTYAPGLFEQTHFLCEMQSTLMYFYENPDEISDLIKYITDFEIEYAEEVCKHLHPEALFRHDDWGTQISTFMSPSMFEEFYFEGTKAIYDCYRENGVKLIVHHSDSYAATLVPDMIKMGIDIWQGAMTSNNISELIEKYGKDITFMGGIDAAKVDFPGWSTEILREEVAKACKQFGKVSFIPCTTQGGPSSVCEGVYETLSSEIDRYNRKYY